MPFSGSPGLRIVDLDPDSLALLALDGKVCFHCPLLEDESLPAPDSGECRVRRADLERLVTDPRAGVKLAVHDGQLVGYAVFGPPASFRNRSSLPFELDDDGLMVAALYVTPEAEQAAVDAALLVEIMGFAGEAGYDTVQAVCRADERTGPEGTVRLFAQAGFDLSEPVQGLALAQISLDDWDEHQAAGPGGEPGSPQDV